MIAVRSFILAAAVILFAVDAYQSPAPTRLSVCAAGLVALSLIVIT